MKTHNAQNVVLIILKTQLSKLLTVITTAYSMQTIQRHTHDAHVVQSDEKTYSDMHARCTGGSVEGAATAPCAGTLRCGHVCTDTGRQALARRAALCGRGGRGRGRQRRDPRVCFRGAPQHLAGMTVSRQDHGCHGLL